MADQFSPDLKSPEVERDIQNIAAEVKRSQDNPEFQKLSGQELLKNSIRSYTGAQTMAQQKAADEDSVLPAYAQTASAETKHEVEYLLRIAFKNGILKASEVASKSNPYVLDTFHDALVGKLYPELKQRGILK